jgi:uncharacterized membrane protein
MKIELTNHLMIGSLVLVLALIYKYLPIRYRIYSFSGASTYSDKKMLIEGIGYSSNLMIIAACITINVQILLILGNVQNAILISIGFLIVSLAMVLILTQNYIRKNYLFKIFKKYESHEKKVVKKKLIKKKLINALKNTSELSRSMAS